MGHGKGFMGWGLGWGMMGREFALSFPLDFLLKAVELEDRAIRLQIQRMHIIYRMPFLGKFLKDYAVKVRMYCSDLCSSSALLMHCTDIDSTSKYLHNHTAA